ncbi:MAG: electron transfer flavoprotein subunit alpha/FixB family protein [Brevinema sp.]
MSKTINRGILVYIEFDRNTIIKNSLELLQEARRLADLVQELVIAVILGFPPENFAQDCIFCGADTVWYTDDGRFKEYLTETHTDALEYLINKIHPNIVLIGSSCQGRDLAPRLSARLNTGLTADCTELDFKRQNDGMIDPKHILLMTRPTYGGNLLATISCENHRPQMATICPDITVIKNTSRTGEIKKFDPPFCPPKVTIIKTIEKLAVKKNIKEEHTLIVGGNGVSTTALFQQLYDLAELLEGGVGVTRALVDKNWADHSQQIGQTGTRVRPNLYLSFGVLGAIQHITGMENSSHIISINKDEEAPIFKFSHLGIVGETEKILPKLIERITEKKKRGIVDK